MCSVHRTVSALCALYAQCVGVPDFTLLFVHSLAILRLQPARHAHRVQLTRRPSEQALDSGCSSLSCIIFAPSPCLIPSHSILCLYCAMARGDATVALERKRLQVRVPRGSSFQ